MTLVKSSSAYSVFAYREKLSSKPASCQIHLETLTCVFQVGASYLYCVETIIADTYDIFVLDFEFVYISLFATVIAVCVNALTSSKKAM